LPTGFYSVGKYLVISLYINGKKGKLMKQKLLALILAFAMLLSLAACGGSEAPASEATTPATTAATTTVTTTEATTAATTQTTTEATVTPDGPELADWSIYWYLCGSDLETNHGCATTDLMEMLEVAIPEGVNIVIETGGAQVWQNELVDASKIQRWLYNSDGLQLLETLESANMGEAQTLYDFLDYANTNFPAEKVAVTFWNHGGGSVTGAAFDELYGLDSLDLGEMYSAFDAVWPANAEAPALELIGFDTCLMATIDVAATFAPFAKYLVGSQEVEPGNGWYYSGWMGALAANPSIDGYDLGIAICNTYYEGCELVGTEAESTLSLTDLSAMPALLEAYEMFGEEMFALAAEDPAFFATLGRAAAQTENYGGNTREQGYTNMLDLGHLARLTAWMLPSAQAVTDALAECVLYQVGGIYRSEATGLSCYYSYNGDAADFNGYASVGAGTAFKHLFAYAINGELGEESAEFLASLEIAELPEIPTLDSMDWDGAPLTVDENGTATLELGPEANNLLTSIGFSLCYVSPETDERMLLGTDNDINADWENGIFRDNFRGVWGALDGVLVYMELSFAGEDYNIYAVPVLVNGEAYNLQVVYDFTEEAWIILGAAPGLDESGMAAKELYLLSEGDLISVLWKLTSYEEPGEYELVEAGEVLFTAETTFGEAPLFDGSYEMIFEMCDAGGACAYSDPVTFDCADGEIFTTVYED